MRKPAIESAAEKDESDINLTPMLDVVFIMLIFFLVVASFVKEEGLDLNRSDAPPVPPTVDDNIFVRIEEDNLIWIEDRLIDPQAIRANIERLRGEQPDAAVIISASSGSATRTLVQVMDASRQAGIYQVSLASQQE